MTQTPIEMAREVAASVIEQQPETGDGFHMRNTVAGVRAGDYDGTTAMKGLLAMHARLTAEHQAAVAELVAGLRVITNYATQCEADEAGDRYFDESDEVKAAEVLIAKHRAPDAFEIWAEGLIDDNE